MEISGPLSSVLQEVLASSPGDLLALLLGERSCSTRREESDQDLAKQIIHNKVTVRNLVIIPAEEILFNMRKGKIMKSVYDKLVSEKLAALRAQGSPGMTTVGLMSYKAAWPEGVASEPSFMDRKRMAVLRESSARPMAYHLVTGVVDSFSLGLKYSSTTFLLHRGVEQSREGPWVARLPLTVPNLATSGSKGGQHYQVGRSGADIVRFPRT